MAKGDHIYSPRYGMLPGLISHHGIDLGDGTIVHFAICDGGKHKVIRTSKKAFAKNGDVLDAERYYEHQLRRSNSLFSDATAIYSYALEKYLKAASFDADEVVERALSQLGNSQEKYSAKNNNCEHFCTLIKKNVAFSEQALDAAGGITPIPGTAAGALTGLVSALMGYKGARAIGYQKSKDGKDYVGSVYAANGNYYFERYTKIFTFPAIWSKKKGFKGLEEDISQKKVPYPLNEVLEFFQDENRNLYYTGDVKLYQKLFSP